MTTISPGDRLDDAELGDEAGAAELRHDQHFAVGVVEAAVGHRAVGGIDVHAHADLGGDVAVAAHGHHALDEVGRLFRNRDRAPAQLRRRRIDVVERRAANEAIVDARVGPVHDRGLDAVGPGAPVLAARRSERGARDQFGVEAVRRTLRRIAADRQRAGHRLGLEMIAEAGLVSQRRGRARRLHVRFAGLCIHATSRGRVRHAPGNWSRSQLISAFRGRGASSLERFQVDGAMSVITPRASARHRR